MVCVNSYTAMRHLVEETNLSTRQTPASVQVWAVTYLVRHVYVGIG